MSINRRRTGLLPKQMATPSSPAVEASFRFSDELIMNQMPRPLWTLRGHRTSVRNVIFFYHPLTEDRRYPSLISGDESGYVIIWDLITRKPINVWKAHNDTVKSIHQVGSQLLTASSDGIKIWSFESSTTQMTHELNVTIPGFTGVAVHENNGEIILAIPLMEAVTVHSLSTGFLKKIELPDTGIVTSLSFLSPSQIVIGYESGTVAVCSLQSTSARSTHPQKSSSVPEEKQTGRKSKLTELLTSAPPSNAIEDPSITISKFNPEDRLLEVQKTPILSLAFSETVIYAAGTSSSITMISLPDFQITSKNMKHSGIESLRLRDDGELLGCVTWDGRVRLFDRELNHLVSLKSGENLQMEKIGGSGTTMQSVNEPSLRFRELQDLDKALCFTFSSIQGHIVSEFEKASDELEKPLSIREKRLMNRKSELADRHLFAVGKKNGTITVYEYQ